MNAQKIKKRLEQFRQLCSENGLKITPQRLAVYETLLSTDRHPSADAVYRQVRRKYPNISLDTVNRTLLTLADIGVAFVVEGSGDPKRFDANTKSHQHCRCIKCRRIMDFEHKSLKNLKLPRNPDGEFKVLKMVIYVEGICADCR